MHVSGGGAACRDRVGSLGCGTVCHTTAVVVVGHLRGLQGLHGMRMLGACCCWRGRGAGGTDGGSPHGGWQASAGAPAGSVGEAEHLERGVRQWQGQPGPGVCTAGLALAGVSCCNAVAPCTAPSQCVKQAFCVAAGQASRWESQLPRQAGETGHSRGRCNAELTLLVRRQRVGKQG